jgi:hypothetical protein
MAMISTFSSLASVMGIWWVCDGRLTEFKIFIAFLACQEREEESHFTRLACCLVLYWS